MIQLDRESLKRVGDYAGGFLLCATLVGFGALFFNWEFRDKSNFIHRDEIRANYIPAFELEKLYVPIKEYDLLKDNLTMCESVSRKNVELIKSLSARNQETEESLDKLKQCELESINTIKMLGAKEVTTMKIDAFVDFFNQDYVAEKLITLFRNTFTSDSERWESRITYDVSEMSIYDKCMISGSLSEKTKDVRTITLAEAQPNVFSRLSGIQYFVWAIDNLKSVNFEKVARFAEYQLARKNRNGEYFLGAFYKHYLEYSSKLTKKEFDELGQLAFLFTKELEKIQAVPKWESKFDNLAIKFVSGENVGKQDFVDLGFKGWGQKDNICVQLQHSDLQDYYLTAFIFRRYVDGTLPALQAIAEALYPY